MDRVAKVILLGAVSFVFAIAVVAVAGAFWSVHLDLTHPAFTLPPCR